MWGLPAASCREGEAILDAAKRIAVQKLGVSVDFGSTLGEGSQEREAYEIKMTLLEAHLDSDDDITLPGGPGNGFLGRRDTGNYFLQCLSLERPGRLQRPEPQPYR